MNELILWLGTYAAYETSAKLMEMRSNTSARPNEVELPPLYQTDGGVAIISVSGTLVEGYIPREYLPYVDSIGYDNIRESVAMAVNDPAVGGLLMVYNSPGGSAIGVEELANFMLSVRAIKPLVSYNAGRMTSAAAWLGSTGTAIYGTKTSINGSIGVKMLHRDISKALEMAGIKYTVIRDGENKALGDPVEPLSEAALAHFKDTAAQLRTMFETAMAENLGMSLESARAAFQDGKDFLGEEALKAGLLTDIGNFEAALSRVRSLIPTTSRAGAPSNQGTPMKLTIAAALIAKLTAAGITEAELAANTQVDGAPVLSAEVLSYVAGERDAAKEAVASAQARLATLEASTSTAQAALDAAKEEASKLAAALTDNLKSMATALNTTVQLEGTPTEILAEYGRVSALYAAKFRPGGVGGSVAPEETKPSGSQPSASAPDNIVMLALRGRQH